QNRAQQGIQEHPAGPQGVLPWEQCVAVLRLSNLARFCHSPDFRYTFPLVRNPGIDPEISPADRQEGRDRPTGEISGLAALGWAHSRSASS
ncbi:MAG TPA: hypothetical protein P5525_05585, partial [Candidatus Paceibacterota bacterium]|nr:hypothetical protein [Candidatus Paceibacterota bacterium]